MGQWERFLEPYKQAVAMYDTYGKFRNTFASTLSGNVKGDNVNAKIRNYASAREAAMSQNHIHLGILFIAQKKNMWH